MVLMVMLSLVMVATTLISFVSNGSGEQCRRDGRFQNGQSWNIPLTPSAEKFPEVLALASSTLTPQDMWHYQGGFQQHSLLGIQHNFPRSRDECI